MLWGFLHSEIFAKGRISQYLVFRGQHESVSDRSYESQQAFFVVLRVFFKKVLILIFEIKVRVYLFCKNVNP